MDPGVPCSQEFGAVYAGVVRSCDMQLVGAWGSETIVEDNSRRQ